MELSPRRQTKAVEKVDVDAGDRLRSEAKRGREVLRPNSAGRAQKRRKLDNLTTVRLRKERKLAARKGD